MSKRSIPRAAGTGGRPRSSPDSARFDWLAGPRVALKSSDSPHGASTRPEGDEPAPDELSAMLALVDQLAHLAADLWFEGRLDLFSHVEPPDADD